MVDYQTINYLIKSTVKQFGRRPCGIFEFALTVKAIHCVVRELVKLMF